MGVGIEGFLVDLGCWISCFIIWVIWFSRFGGILGVSVREIVFGRLYKVNYRRIFGFWSKVILIFVDNCFFVEIKFLVCYLVLLEIVFDNGWFIYFDLSCLL